MQQRTLLIQCAGHGLGNAARVLAVTEALREALSGAPAESKSIHIEIASWGNALPFLKKHQARLGYGLTELESFQPRPTGIPAYLRNCRKLEALLERTRPDLALLDSDLHFLPLRKRKIPIYCLGQAHEVLRRARVWGIWPRGWKEWKSLLAFEVLDAWIQRRAAERVLIPCANPRNFPTSDRLIPVPLIVRDTFAKTPIRATPRTAPLAMLLSGSGIEADTLEAWARKRGIHVLKSSLKEDGTPAIDDYRAVIIQGGLSSISECVARRRAMVVVPIAGHFEQRVNAFEVEMQGLGGYQCRDLARDGDLTIDRLGVSSFLFEMPEAEIGAELTRTDGASAVAGEILKRLERGACAGP